MKSRADNTVKKYNTYYNKWSSWCLLYRISALPAKGEHVALFLTSLIQNNQSADVIEAVYYTIEYFHKINLCDTPYETSLCEMILEASRKLLKARKKKKEPLTADHFRSIYMHVLVRMTVPY